MRIIQSCAWAWCREITTGISTTKDDEFGCLRNLQLIY